MPNKDPQSIAAPAISTTSASTAGQTAEIASCRSSAISISSTCLGSTLTVRTYTIRSSAIRIKNATVYAFVDSHVAHLIQIAARVVCALLSAALSIAAVLVGWTITVSRAGNLLALEFCQIALFVRRGAGGSGVASNINAAAIGSGASLRSGAFSIRGASCTSSSVVGTKLDSVANGSHLEKPGGYFSADQHSGAQNSDENQWFHLFYYTTFD